MNNYERLIHCSPEELLRFMTTHSKSCYWCAYATFDDRCRAPRPVGIYCEQGIKLWLEREDSDEDFWRIKG